METPWRPQSHRAFVVILLALILPFLSAYRVAAQDRPNDKDIEQRMKNLSSDTKKFRSMFSSALSKSTIHKTGQESDAKILAENLENNTKNMLDSFKKGTKADPYLLNCLDTAGKIDGVFKSTQLDADTVGQWQRVQSQLKDLARAFHVPGY
jgi:hypothetical protein